MVDASPGTPSSGLDLESRALETAIAIASAFIHGNTHKVRKRTTTRAYAMALVARAIGKISWAAIAAVTGRSGGSFAQVVRQDGDALAASAVWVRFMSSSLQTRVRCALLQLAAGSAA